MKKDYVVDYFERLAITAKNHLFEDGKYALFRENVKIKTVESVVEQEDIKTFRLGGMASTFFNVDRDNDVISTAAFDETLIELKARGILPMLLDHCPWIEYQVGAWDQFEKQENGLYLEGNAVLDEVSQHAYKLIKLGMLNTLSIGGIFKYGDPKEIERDGRIVRVWPIEKITLFETSIVVVPANPLAIFELKAVSVHNNNIEVDEKTEQVESKDPELSQSDLIKMTMELIQRKAG